MKKLILLASAMMILSTFGVMAHQMPSLTTSAVSSAVDQEVITTPTATSGNTGGSRARCYTTWAWDGDMWVKNKVARSQSFYEKYSHNTPVWAKYALYFNEKSCTPITIDSKGKKVEVSKPQGAPSNPDIYTPEVLMNNWWRN